MEKVVKHKSAKLFMTYAVGKLEAAFNKSQLNLLTVEIIKTLLVGSYLYEVRSYKASCQSKLSDHAIMMYAVGKLMAALNISH